MVGTPLSGSFGFLVGYGLTVVGLLVGLRRAAAPLRKFAWAPVVAIPTLIVLAIVWSVLIGTQSAAVGLWQQFVTMLFGAAFFVGGSVAAGVWFGRVKTASGHQRGTRVVDGPSGPLGAPDQNAALCFASCPLPYLDETKHFKIIGTTGTGKSTVIRTLLEGALARRDRAVIADPDGSYMAAFYNPGRGDVVLNPFHPKAAAWDLFGEIVVPHDADQLARSLIPDHEGSDRIWRGYSRTFLTALLRQMHRIREHDIAKLYYLLVMAPPEQLRELLEATPAGPFLGQDNGKFFESVRAVAVSHLSALEHVARQEAVGSVGVRQWIREGSGVLFLPYKAGEIAALRQTISTLMRLAIFETMNVEPSDQRLWFAIDELDALGPIDGLKDALVRLRKYGGRCVLGFQSIAQMRGLYGDADAQTIVENCGNTLIMRSSASERGGTPEFASRLIGKREIIRLQTSHSRPTRWGGGMHRTQTLSEQHAIEDAVMASEIEQLPDLSGFVKIASQPEWRRVTISRR